MAITNYILALIFIIAGTILVAVGSLEWAIWVGILALWAMGNYLASKIDDLEKKIDNNNKS